MHVQLRVFRCSLYLTFSLLHRVQSKDTGTSGSLSSLPLIPFQTSEYSPGSTKNPECYQGILKRYLLQHDQLYRKTKQKLDVKPPVCKTTLQFCYFCFSYATAIFLRRCYFGRPLRAIYLCRTVSQAVLIGSDNVTFIFCRFGFTGLVGKRD